VDDVGGVTGAATCGFCCLLFACKDLEIDGPSDKFN